MASVPQSSSLSHKSSGRNLRAISTKSRSESTIGASPVVKVTAHGHAHGTGRPRVHSASTTISSPTTTSAFLQVEKPPILRAVSSSLSQPSLQTTGNGRGRATYFASPDKSTTSSRDPSTECQCKHCANTAVTSRTGLNHASSSILDHPQTFRANIIGDEHKEDENTYWWHSRSGTPRPWFEPASPKEKQKEQSVVSSNEVSPSEALEDAPPLGRKGGIPAEQSESWIRTKEKVTHATEIVLGYALGVLHEGLEVGAEVLELSPIPGLAKAAKVLLGIWDAVQTVDSNRLSCLRLAERCATILISVKQEIDVADVEKAVSPRGSLRGMPSTSGISQYNAEGTRTSRGSVGDELKAPLEQLVDAFTRVLQVLECQNRRPFLKRYLKRDETIRDLVNCDQTLNDALGMFNISVQVRILKQVLSIEKRWLAETSALVNRFIRIAPTGYNQVPHAIEGEGSSSEGIQFPEPASSQSIHIGMSAVNSPHAQAFIPPHPILPSNILTTQPQVSHALAEVIRWQNTRDMNYDADDLHRLLRGAIETHDDHQIMRLMQVRTEEAPEALKALRRALEEEQVREERDRFESAPEGGLSLSEQAASVGSMQGILDGVLGDKGTASEGISIPVKKPTSDSLQSTTASDHSHSSPASHDTIHREFMETGIESLVRLSLASGKSVTALSLPSWTITRYEVDRDERIGVGFFSEVWKGRYRGRTVAVKVLAPWTPKDMFLQEAKVWNELRHENILEMVGASAVEPDQADYCGWSAPGNETMPWFFVSRYYQRGNLIKWVKGLSDPVWKVMLDDASRGVLRMIHEMVLGMEYLHSKGILHGDFKCANVLINDYGHCIISDFGQSELKSEAYRISGTPLPHGTLRWQAPELMEGVSKLTQQMDIYSFAMSCVEVLTKGGVPWLIVDDNSVRHLVLRENKRPDLPTLTQWSPHLAEIIQQCWARKPESRPSFSHLNRLLVTLRMRFGWNGTTAAELGEVNDERDWIHWIDEIEQGRLSPEMTPRQSHQSLHGISELDVPSFDIGDSFVTAPHGPDTSTSSSNIPPPMHHSISEPPTNTAAPTEHSSDLVRAYQAVGIHPPRPPRAPTRESSIAFSLPDSEPFRYPSDSSASSLPPDQFASDSRNERRYRMVLEHDFNHSLTLPLWTPSRVKIAAVGFHERPSGAFVTLFNAFEPLRSSGGKVTMSSLNVYGKVTTSCQKNDKLEKRSAARKGIGFIQSLLSRNKDDSTGRTVVRRYSAPLRNGRKTASLFTESTVYNYVADADLLAPKTWFHKHIDDILNVYGQEHQLQREDVMLVIGTIETPNYALFVSHSHPDVQVNFNVFASPKLGQPWGDFSTDLSTSTMDGPVYHEDMPQILGSSKISNVRRPNDPWDTVLIARLRFAPDKEEPTSL